MRHGQRGAVDGGVAIQQQIEVERARRVAIGPFAAVRLLDACSACSSASASSVVAMRATALM
jgi:hypothetical protein